MSDDWVERAKATNRKLKEMMERQRVSNAVELIVIVYLRLVAGDDIEGITRDIEGGLDGLRRGVGE